MTLKTQLVIVIINIFFSLMVLKLFRSKKLTIPYCLWWLSLSCSVIIIVLNNGLLRFVTRIVGTLIPMSALTLLGLAFIVAILIYFSVEISRLSGQVKTLAQQVALMKDDIHRL